tara:strand:+ start:2448 stop:2678 length:231 start_codon:yes stop_codon:yes gene_type:complete
MKLIRKYKYEIVLVLVLTIALGAVTLANHEPIKEELNSFDSLEFGEAFNCMYEEHGEGHIFEWRGNSYITLYKENK